MKRTILGLFACWLTYGQTPTPPLSFEVASVKVTPKLLGQSASTPVEFEVAAVHKSAMPSQRAMPMLGVTNSRLEIMNYALIKWIAYAYDVPEFQISSPEGISREKYDLSAKLPQGSTKRQAPAMLQSFLAERFGLRIHRKAQKMSGYALVVQKGGAHVKPSLSFAIGPEAEPSDELRSPTADSVEFVYKNCTMSHFAQLLSKNVREPVVDATNLAGAYDVPFGFSIRDILPKPNSIDADDGGLGPSIGDSVRRLGLKLERRGVTVEIIVVDNLSRPTAN
jgi:uncharacterized protein (TIGR03435 family)